MQTLQKLLYTRIVETQGRNPQFSLRAFAKKIGIGSGPLSQILSGRRTVSRKMAVKLCDALLLDPQERHEVLSEFPDKKLEHVLKTGNASEFLKLSHDQFSVIADWHHFAILYLVETKDFKPKTTWIAERLGIQERQAEQAVERLFRLGLIEAVSKTEWKLTNPSVRTTDDIENLSLRKNHFQNLELARASLEHDSVEDRDFTTLTVATHPNKLKQAKELIRKFQDDMMHLLEDTKESTEVYRMSIELFPLTRLRNPRSKK